MTIACTTRAAAAAWRPAAFGAILLGLAVAGSPCAQAAPEFGRAPDAASALTYAQAVQQPGAPPPGGAMMGRGRGIARAQFIERRRQMATSKGRDPEQAAAIAARIFDMADTNHDGVLDRAEIQAFRAAHPQMGQGRGGGAGAPGQAPAQ